MSKVSPQFWLLAPSSTFGTIYGFIATVVHKSICYLLSKQRSHLQSSDGEFNHIKGGGDSLPSILILARVEGSAVDIV